VADRSLGEIFVNIRGDLSKLQGDFDKAKKMGEDAAKGIGASFAGVGTGEVKKAVKDVETAVNSSQQKQLSDYNKFILQKDQATRNSVSEMIRNQDKAAAAIMQSETEIYNRRKKVSDDYAEHDAKAQNYQRNLAKQGESYLGTQKVQLDTEQRKAYNASIRDGIKPSEAFTRATGQASEQATFFGHNINSLMKRIILTHFALQALYGVLNAVKQGFMAGLAAVEDYEVKIASMSAFLTSFNKNVTQENASEIYRKSNEEAKNLVLTMEKLDARSIASGKDLTTMAEQFIKGGVKIDTTNKGVLDGFVNIANATKLLTKGQNQEIQMRQEIRALVEGQMKDSNILAKTLQSIDPNIKEHIKLWKEEGTIIENVGELLSGFGPAAGDLANTWAVVGSTMETVMNKILRGAFESTYNSLISSAKFWNKTLMDSQGNLTPIAVLLQNILSISLEIGKALIGGVLFAAAAVGIGGAAYYAFTGFFVLIQAMTAATFTWAGAFATLTATMMKNPYFAIGALVLTTAFGILLTDYISKMGEVEQGINSVGSAAAAKLAAYNAIREKHERIMGGITEPTKNGVSPQIIPYVKGVMSQSTATKLLKPLIEETERLKEQALTMGKNATATLEARIANGEFAESFKLISKGGTIASETLDEAITEARKWAKEIDRLSAPKIAQKEEREQDRINKKKISLSTKAFQFLQEQSKNELSNYKENLDIESQLLEAQFNAKLISEGSYFDKKRAMQEDDIKNTIQNAESEIDKLSAQIIKFQSLNIGMEEGGLNDKMIERLNQLGILTDAQIKKLETLKKVFGVEDIGKGLALDKITVQYSREAAKAQSAFKLQDIESALQAEQELIDLYKSKSLISETELWDRERDIQRRGLLAKRENLEAELIAAKEARARALKDLISLDLITGENKKVTPELSEAVAKSTQDVANLTQLLKLQNDEIGRYNKLTQLSRKDVTSWVDGASEALNKYARTAENVFDSVGQVVDKAFKGMEDALVSFVTTGKLNFADLANSIITYMIRIAIQQSITGPLASAMAPTQGVSGSGFFGAIASMFTPSAKGNVFSGISGFSNQIVSKPTLFNHGGLQKFASGGGLMGEAGPEAIMPLKRMSNGGLGVSSDGGGGVNLNVNIANNANADVKTQATPDGKGGINLEIIIDKIVGKKTNEFGSATNKSLRQGMGASPMLVSR